MSDLISRADAIEAVCKECSERWKHYKECDLYKDGQCFEITALMALPSADVVYGKWIPIEETLPTYDGGEKTWITGMKCSNCGKLLDLRIGYYYCPNCGARMYKGGGNE